MNVLLIDPDTADRQSAESINDECHCVVAVETIAEAMEYTKKKRFDLVVIDPSVSSSNISETVEFINSIGNAKVFVADSIQSLGEPEITECMKDMASEIFQGMQECRNILKSE